MKKIDKVILKLENDLAQHEDTINELVEKISNFNLFDYASNTVEEKYCMFQFFVFIKFCFYFLYLNL